MAAVEDAVTVEQIRMRRESGRHNVGMKGGLKMEGNF